jgi:hypothetical protein
LKPRPLLDGANFGDDGFERPSHQLVHGLGFMAFHEVWIVSIPREELREFGVGEPGQNRGICNFVSVQMQNGKNGAIARRIQEFVGVPACRERARFGFSISDHATDQKVRIVVCGSVGVGNRIA